MSTSLERRRPNLGEAKSNLGTALRKWRAGDGASPISSSRELVAVALREAIVSGDVASGEQLKQDELAAYFQVSPGPVREALRQLENEGLVQHHLNRGVFVTELPEDEALEVLLPVRLLLEDYALRRVPENLFDELVDQLNNQIQLMVQGAAHGDVSAINEGDVRFHQIAVEASGAFHTIQLWHSVLPRIRRQIYVLAPRHPDLHEVPREHQVLLAALQAGDPQELSQTLREHIIGTSSALMMKDLD